MKRKNYLKISIVVILFALSSIILFGLSQTMRPGILAKMPKNLNLITESADEVYSVNFALNTGVWLDGTEGSKIVNVNSGGKVKELKENVDCEKEGHYLEGWYLDTKFQNKYDFNLPVTENLILYANWVPKEYTVKFYNAYDSINNTQELLATYEIPYGYTLVLSGSSDENKTFEFTGEIPTKENYKFVDWISDTGTYSIIGDTNFTARFTGDTIYYITLKYVYQNGNTAATNYTTTLTEGEEYNIDTEELEGYTASVENVSGIATKEELEKLKELDYVEIDNSVEGLYKVSYIIKYVPARSLYKVEHYLQNLDGSYSIVADDTVTNSNSYVGDIVKAETNNYEGYTLNHSISTLEDAVEVNGTLVLKAYYDRKTYYIYWDSQEGTYYNPTPVTYGADISNIGADKIPEKSGYVFVRWEETTGQSFGTMPNQNLQYVAVWEKEKTSYTITYWVENANNDGFTNTGNYTISNIDTESFINLESTEVKNYIDTGFENLVTSEYIDYYYYDEEKTKDAIDGDFNSYPIKRDGTTIINVYYRRNIYTLRFMIGRDDTGVNQISHSTQGSVSSSGWTTVEEAPYIIKNNTTYYTNEYTIKAKYGADISELWPSVDDAIDNVSNGSTKYYFISWGTQNSSESNSYWQNHTNKNILGIYGTMSEELIIDKTDTSAEHLLIAYWSTNARYFKYHYMFEKLDQTETTNYTFTNNGVKKYYEEGQVAVVRSTNTAGNLSGAALANKKLVGKYTEATGQGSSCESTAVDIYFYYDLDEHIITLYNVNQNVVPNFTTDELSELAKVGINIENNQIVAKYGANIQVLNKLRDSFDKYDNFKYPLTLIGKKDKVFDKWYLEPNYLTEMDWEDTNLITIEDNLTLYAKWADPTYDIVFDLDGGTWEDSDSSYVEENGNYKKVIDEGTILTEPTAPKKSGYKFTSWMYELDVNGYKVEIPYLFGASQKIYDDLKLIASWTPEEKYVSYFVNYIKAEYDESGKVINDITKYKEIIKIADTKQVDNILFNSVISETALDVIVYKGEEYYIADAASRTLTVNAENDEDNVIYFFYSNLLEIEYTVYYLENGDEYEVGEIPDESRMIADPKHVVVQTSKGSFYTETALDIGGYTPVGSWTKSIQLVSDFSQNTLYFYYEPNQEKGNYNINFYFMNENGAYNITPTETIKVTGPVGKILYAEDYIEYAGIDEKYFIGHVLDYSISDAVGVVTKATDAVLNVYFKNGTYSITYNLEEGVWTDEDARYVKNDEEYVEKVTYPACAKMPKEPTKEGYRFIGWFNDNTSLEESNKYDFSTKVSTNINLYAGWVETINKTVSLVWEDDNNRDDIRPEEVEIQVILDGIISDDNKLVLNAENNWQYEYKELDKYIDGKERTFSVEENLSIDSYTAEYNQDTLTVTLIHIPETVTKTITKIWNDKANQDGIRPEEITIELLENGTLAKEIVLSETNKQATVMPDDTGEYWSVNLTDLLKYNDGIEIKYTVKEKNKIDSYTTEYNQTSLTIINTHEIELTDKEIKIVWDDNNNQDGKREKVEVQLYANGVDTGKIVTLEYDNQNEISYTFEDLEKYSAGKEIVYTIKQENEIEGYTTSYSDNSLTITNTHIPEIKDQTVTKIWRDGDNKDFTRPDSINVQLFANGEKVGNKVTLTINDATVFENADGETVLGNNWEHTWTDLPVYENGKEIKYVVVEDSVPNYSTKYSSKNLTIYNAYPPEVDINVEKVWDDQEDRDGIRAESVEVQLYADNQEFIVDGENIGKVELNESNNWQYEWPYLEKYNNNGEEIVYTIEELTQLPKYTTKYKDSGEITVTDTTVSSERTISIINEYNPKQTEMSAIVKWEDNNNQDGIRPEKVELELVATLSDGTECTFESETEKVADVTEENEWKHTWTSVSLNANHGEEIQYTLREKEISGYTYSVKYDEILGMLVITNTHIPEVIEKTVKVVWEDNENQDGIRPENLNITVNKENTEISTVEVNEQNNWEVIINDLEKYENGQEVEYSVLENISVEGYTVEYSEDTFTITISHIPEIVEKELKVIWNDGNNQDGIRPNEIVVIVLKDDKNLEKVTLSEDNSWTKEYTSLNKYELGKEINYLVKQNVSVDKYSVEYSEDTFTITLTYVPETITKKAIKVWKDNFNQDGIRPNYIEIGLFADGKNVQEIKLEESNSWQHEFKDLPKNNNGTEIEYTIEELTNVTGYTPQYKNDGNTIIYILNNHDIETVTKVINVEFEDNEDQDGIRPEEIVVTVLKDGLEYQTITISAENNWKAEVIGEKYKEQGKEVVYSIKEDVSIENYDTTYNELTIKNTHIPEKTEKTVTVKWEDNNNQDGIRPEEVEVEFLANGTVIDTKTVTSDTWTYTWDSIDKYENKGNEIEYTARQKTKLDKYTTISNGVEIINTHIPSETEKTVKVVWDDNENQDGIRPSQIRVKLLKNGVEYKEETITEGTWEYTFTGLPEYENTVKVEYIVEENINISGYTTTYSDDKLTITNTHTPEKISKTAEKTWNDNNNVYGVRPEEVSVQLFANGVEIGNIVKLNERNNWKYTWDNLEKYANGKEISYTVKERDLPAKYSVTYENDGLEVINTCPPQTDKTVKVVWDDNEDVGGIRPDSIRVKLNATLPDGTEFDISSMVETEVVLNENNNWSYTWNVSQYKVVGLNVDDWIEINYSIEEIDTVANYQTEYTSKEFTNNSNITITNTLNKFEYTVNYYYDGVKDDTETVVEKAFLNNGITEYEDKIRTGYRLEDVTGIPLQITGDASQNIINVYYVRKDTKVTIKYIDQVSGTEIDIQKEIEGKYGDKLNLADYQERLIGYVYLGNDSGETDTISMTEENRTITYKYAKEANVVVKYLEKDTNEVLKTEKQIDGYEGKKYEAKAETIDGYRLEIIPDNASGKMVEGETIVIFQYVQATKVITEYIDKYTNEVLDKIEISGYVGDEVDINTKKIEGYYLLDGQINKEIVLTKEVQTVQYEYAKKTNVIVKFLERDTESELAEEVIIDGYQGKNYEAESIEIDGYTLVSETNKVTDVMPRDGDTVKFYYAKQTTITVEHIDKMTNEKLDTVVDDVLVGNIYAAVAKDFDGYILTGSPENEMVKVTKEAQTLKYYYTKVSEGVIVKYIDEITNGLLDECIITGLEGDEYQTENKSFDGYTFIKTEGLTEGNLSTGIIEVKYYYRKNMKVIVEHIDKISNKILDTETITGYEDKEYKTKDKEITGYELVEEPSNKDGTMKQEITYVRYYYKYISVVKVHYIDMNSKDVLDYIEINGLESDEYQSEEKNITSYTLVKVSDNRNGHMTKETIDVYYEYAKVSKGVEVNYIDKITNEIMKTEIIPGYEEKEYRAEEKNFDGYDIVKEDIPSNISGKMKVEKTTVNIYYIAKSKIVVKYVEKISGKQLVEDVIIEGHETDEYITEEKEIEYYKLIETTENISGNMKKGTETVTYYYRKLEFKANVDKLLTNATLNGKNIKVINNTLRLDVKSREIEETELVLEYTIRVSNTGELAGKISLEEILNKALIFDANKSSELWIKQGNKLISTVEIAVGETKELKIVLKWKANEKNIGEITPITKIVDIENEAGFIEYEVDEKLTTQVVLGIFTGIECGREILVVVLILLIKIAINLQKKRKKLKNNS